MKKIMALILVLALAATICGCEQLEKLACGIMLRTLP